MNDYRFPNEPEPEPRPNGHSHEDHLDPIASIDWLRLRDVPPPERQFIIEHWLGRGHVTLVVADSGVGKTQLALQLAISTAMGKPWLGLATRGAPALMPAAEDDDDELHRRVCRTIPFMGIAKPDLAGRLFLQGRVGLRNALMLHPNGRQAQPLPLLEHIEEQAKAIGAGVIFLDNAAQLYTGDENDRSQVTAFINGLAGVARRTGAAVLLLAHPPKTGADYSGSTAWHAGVRSLWTPKRPGEFGELVLTRAKANYATTGEAIRLKWLDGALRLVDERTTGMEAVFRKHEVATAFLQALAELSSQGRAASHNKRAANYAPRLILEAGLGAGFADRDLERAMNELLREKRLQADARLWQRPNRTWVSGLAEVGSAPAVEAGGG
jgi:RecA-family ATPase